MFIQLLKRAGYKSAEDAIEFIMAGIGIVPPLLMLGGFVFAGALALFVLILLLATVGIFIPPPPAAAEKIDKKDKKPLG